MLAYVVSERAVTDPTLFKEYMKRGATALARYGGRFLLRGGAVGVLQGEPPASRVVILEFPSREQAEAWWNSPDYAEASEFRTASSKGKAYLVPGYAGG
jgi:uncharacterized protein (DUF1330 family)